MSRTNGQDVGSRPRLVVVASTFPGQHDDGTPAFVRDLSLRLGDAFETVVLVPRVPGAPPREQIGDIVVERFAYFPRRWERLADGAMLDNLRSGPLGWLQAPAFLLAEAASLRRLIRRHRPDVLHLHWIIPQGIAALMVGRGVPWVVTTHGADLYAIEGPISRWLKRRILRRAAEVTGGNPEMHELLIAHGADPANTHIRPMGAEIDQFRVLAGDRQPVPGRILFVGRLSEKKGVSVLLDAVRQLPSGLGWSLEVAGDGALRGELEEQARGLESVTFLGTSPRQRLGTAYAEASVVVVPSIRASSGDQDAMPLVILEAMGVGRPVIASDLSGLDVAVTHEKTGLLVPPGDAAALAEALQRLLTDDALRTRLGEAAAVRATDFSVETCAKYFVELLTSASRSRSDR